MTRPPGAIACFAHLLTIGCGMLLGPFAARTPAQDGAAFSAPSARSAGLAGTRLGTTTDATGIDRNPAMLAMLDGSRVDATGIVYVTRTHAETRFGSSDGIGGDLHPGGTFAIAWRPEFEGARPLTFGFGVLPQGGFRSRLDLPIELYPQGVRHRSDFVYHGVFGGVAWAPLDALAIGASVALEVGDLRIESPTEQPTALFQGVFPFLPDLTWRDFFQNGGLDEFVARVDLDTATRPGLGFRLGTIWSPHDRVRVGAFWKPPSLLPDYEGRGTIDTTAQFGPIDEFFVATYGQSVFPDGFVAKYDVAIQDLEMPQMAGIGASVTITERVLAGVDVTWLGWSSTFDRLRVELENGSNPGFNDIVGSSSLVAETPLGWRDQVAASVGLEWSVGAGWTLRGGYRYANSPVPDDALDPIAPAITEHGVAIGVGWSRGCWSVDAAWLHSFPSREGSGTNVVQSDYDGLEQSFRLDTVLLQAGVRF